MFDFRFCSRTHAIVQLVSFLLSLQVRFLHAANLQVFSIKDIIYVQKIVMEGTRSTVEKSRTFAKL